MAAASEDDPFSFERFIQQHKGDSGVAAKVRRRVQPLVEPRKRKPKATGWDVDRRMNQSIVRRRRNFCGSCRTTQRRCHFATKVFTRGNQVAQHTCLNSERQL